MHPHNHHSTRLLLGVLVVTIGTFGAVLTSGTLAAADGRAPVGRSAKTLSVNEHGALHLISKHGFTLNEQGTASGSISGPIKVQLKIVSTSRVTAEVTFYPKGGSITGRGTGSYHKGGASDSFSGSMTVADGSGSYAHAQGTGLSFGGTISQSNDAITVYVNGKLTD
jgi:hypothetical protein